MNTCFNTALKQSTSLRKDLAALSRPDFATVGHGQDHDHGNTVSAPVPVPVPLTPAALGSLSASLTAFSRTVDDYGALARQELNRAKADKASERLRNFRAELSEFRAQLDALKAAARDVDAQAQATQNRAELLGRRPFTTATPENPYGGAGAANTSSAGYGVPRPSSSAETGYGGPSTTSMGSGDAAREAHALREQNFFAGANSALDEYIARGQAVLGDLGQQRDMLKNTQRKLYSVGNTLGISGDTIRMIERRAVQDKWIFGAGVVVFFLFCWLVLHYLG